MRQLPVDLPECAWAIEDFWDFCMFLSKLANRWFQGHFRYGTPDRQKRYMDRLEEEVKEYRKTGNYEHYINVAVYVYLEGIKPQNSKHYFDNTAESATRGKGF